MGGCPEAPDLINLFALVKYLPNPLGAFLNSLRQELVPSCHLRAHVTVLPPRRIEYRDRAWDRIQHLTAEVPPVELELGDIEIFPVTSVIYCSIRRGERELVDLHNYLAQDSLAFVEPYKYHPHVTLAQGLVPEQVEKAATYARRRWRDFSGKRSFHLESMTFVQSTAQSDWVDLGEVSLRAVGVPR